MRQLSRLRPLVRPALTAVLFAALALPASAETVRVGRPTARGFAAKAHASWAMYLGSGLADVERHVQRAAHVLQVEAVRECLRRRTSLDRATLTTAIRQADLLLVHLADPQQLHRAAVRSR